MYVIIYINKYNIIWILREHWNNNKLKLNRLLKFLKVVVMENHLHMIFKVKKLQK